MRFFLGMKDMGVQWLEFEEDGFDEIGYDYEKDGFDEVDYSYDYDDEEGYIF